jgi:aminoglycoside phosphotransferase (APT) family kinase protein
VTQSPRVKDRFAAPVLNRVQRLHEEGHDIVRRYWAERSIADILGSDRVAEVTAQRLVAAIGRAPPVLAVDFDAGWMSMPFVAGARIDALWWERGSSSKAVLDLLAALRLLPSAQLPMIHLADRARRLHRELEALSPQLAQRWDAPLTHCLNDWESEPSLAHQALDCFVHGDLSPENLLCTPDGHLVLLDFEYAHRGHRLEDLAGLVVSCAVAASHWTSWVSGPETALFDTLVRTRVLLDGLWVDLASVLTGNAAAARAH